MSNSTTGWLWVAGQGVLLGALVFWPDGDVWGRPSALLALAVVLFFGGLGLVVISALGLGAAHPRADPIRKAHHVGPLPVCATSDLHRSLGRRCGHHLAICKLGPRRSCCAHCSVL